MEKRLAVLLRALVLVMSKAEFRDLAKELIKEELDRAGERI